MSVYIVVQLKMKNRERYNQYQSKFMEVFKKYNGKLLAADENPEVVEGEWDLNKVVIMEFPDKESYLAWGTSSEYVEIAKDRIAGADATVLVVKSV